MTRQGGLLLLAVVAAALVPAAGGLRAAPPKAPTLDPSFGTKGVVRLATLDGPWDERPRDVLTDAQGRVLVLFNRIPESASAWGEFLLARLTPQGAVDATYADGGYLDLDAHGRFFALARDGQGRILVAGHTTDDSLSRLALDLRVLRLTPDGELDGTFGDGGAATIPIPGTAEWVVQVVADAQDRPVVGVYEHDGLASYGHVVRFTEGGLPDASFGTLGRFSDAATVPAAIRGIAADGVRVVVAGLEEDRYGGGVPIRVLRLDGSGAPDGTFGEGGVVRIDDDDLWHGDVTGVGVDASGRVVLGGNHDVSFETPHDAIVVRLTATGALDASFGGGDGALVFDPSRGGYEWLTHFRVAPGGAGHYVMVGDMTNRNGNGAGLWVAEIPQEGGAPRVLRHRISDDVGVARTHALAFTGAGQPVVAMSYEPYRGEDDALDLYLARVRPTPSGPPDLTVAWTKAPTQKPGAVPGPLRGKLSVANGGAQAAGRSVVRLYASDDATLDAWDALLGDVAVPALGPGATRVLNLKLRTSATLAGRRIFAVADAADAVAEKDETNQLAASAPVP